jgi:phospholipid/cholesterol/gamma-HCH transport system substrate-binding protein
MQSKFQANYRLEAHFQNVSGLEEGADVRVGGLRKGTVRKIELPSQPDGKLTVVMDMSRKTRAVLKQDSLASIKSEGLVGNKYVEISFGSKDAPALPDGATIASNPPVDIADLIGKTSQILDSTQVTLGHLESATESADAIVAKMNSGRGTAGALINDKSVYQEANAAAEALHQDAEALKHNFLLRGYFHKRGYTNPAEVQKHAVEKLPAQSPQKVFNYADKQLVDKPDSVKLKNQKALNEAGEYIEEAKPGLVIIESSTGPKGESEKDQQLSEARADAVRSYLLDHFNLEDQRLKIWGKGKTDGEGGLRILVYEEARSGKK